MHGRLLLISDPEIFRKSGAVDLIKPGDQIMVDKGFLIDEDVITRGVLLFVQPLKMQNSSFY
jgi:hypothetical protein